MENSVKGIIIAAAVLIAIVIIAMGVLIVRGTPNSAKQSEDVAYLMDSTANKAIESVRKNRKSSQTGGSTSGETGGGGSTGGETGGGGSTGGETGGGGSTGGETGGGGSTGGGYNDGSSAGYLREIISDAQNAGLVPGPATSKTIQILNNLAYVVNYPQVEAYIYTAEMPIEYIEYADECQFDSNNPQEYFYGLMSQLDEANIGYLENINDWSTINSGLSQVQIYSYGMTENQFEAYLMYDNNNDIIGMILLYYVVVPD